MADIVSSSENEILFLRFQLVLSNLRGSILLVNKEGRVEFVNEAFCKLFNITASPRSLFGLSSSDILQHIENGYLHPSAALARIKELVLINESVIGEEVALSNGRTVIRDFIPINIGNQGYGRMWYHQDITDRKAAEEKIKNLAFYDALTQLPNRRLLNDRLIQAIAVSRRRDCYGALMVLDLDNFKPINDTYGHDVGDMVLTEVARRISSCVREIDTVARFGGDEFVVMLSELDVDKAESVKKVSIVAEKIRASLSEPYHLTIFHEGKTGNIVKHHCTSSIGIAMFNGNSESMDVLKSADMAMFQAKRLGRNQFKFCEQSA